MNRTRIYHIAGFIFTVIAGTLLHFIYDWQGGLLAAILGAVNESTWEHLKLLFWPMLLFGIFEYFRYGKNMNGFIPVKTASILLGLLTVIVLFYTYTGILGFHVSALDIGIFVFAVFLSYFFSARTLDLADTAQEPKGFWQSSFVQTASVITLLALIICFIVFPFYPPHIGLFLDPVSQTYGTSIWP